MGNFGCNVSHHKPVQAVRVPARSTCRDLSGDIQFVEIRHCSEDLHNKG